MMRIQPTQPAEAVPLHTIMVKLYLVILGLAAVGSVRGSSEVAEGSAPYPCCENPKIQFDQHCSNTWTTNNKIIAYSNGLYKQCISPCKDIEGGWMMLDECAHVNVTVVCTDEMKVTVEKRIYYYDQPCAASLLEPVNLGLMLIVVIGGQFVK